MTAKLDKSRNTYFVIGPSNVNTCAAVYADWSRGPAVMGGYPEKKAWTVCEHLSTPEKVLAYHRGENPILIVHGFVLCQECNNRNILTGQDGFNKMLRGSIPQDDIFFQKHIMKEDITDEYGCWAKLLPGSDDKTERTKHVCVHLETTQKLNEHYASRQTLFWHHDNLLCAACLNDLKNGSSGPVEDKGVWLQQKIFNKQIISPLCHTNSRYFGLRG